MTLDSPSSKPSFISSKFSENSVVEMISNCFSWREIADLLHPNVGSFRKRRDNLYSYISNGW